MLNNAWLGGDSGTWLGGSFVWVFFEEPFLGEQRRDIYGKEGNGREGGRGGEILVMMERFVCWEEQR